MGSMGLGAGLKGRDGGFGLSFQKTRGRDRREELLKILQQPLSTIQLHQENQISEYSCTG